MMTLNEILMSMSQVVDRVNDERRTSDEDRDTLIEMTQKASKDLGEQAAILRSQIEAAALAMESALKQLQWGLVEAFKGRDAALHNIITISPAAPDHQEEGPPQ